MVNDLSARKLQLEERLARHGINEYRVTYLPYLEFDDKTFATPYEAGQRMMILYAVAYTAAEPDAREKITGWLMREKLWEHVSPAEKKLFAGDVTDEQELIDFSWEGESAYILAWSLNLVEETPTPAEQVTEEQLDDFVSKVPALGDETDGFLRGLSYRPTVEIYDENLFHELATTYFRDLFFNGKENASDIHSGISLLRHKTLNWLRRFQGIDEWDYTDTST